MQTDKNFQIINATLEAIAPIVRINGTDEQAIESYVYYLLYIAGAFADQIKMPNKRFHSLAILAYSDSKIPQDSNKSN